MEKFQNQDKLESYTKKTILQVGMERCHIHGDDRLAISSHMAKFGNKINTAGEVRIVDFDLNEVWMNNEALILTNPDRHSDQFGYSMISTDLMIDGESIPCLMIGAPVATYGI